VDKNEEIGNWIGQKLLLDTILYIQYAYLLAIIDVKYG
jgi:hypothetical protein